MLPVSIFSYLFLILLMAGCSTSKPVYVRPVESSADSIIVSGNSDRRTAGKIRSVFFASNMHSLNSRAKKVLKQNADFLKKHPSLVLSIEGHCDQRGSKTYNSLLGARRAKAVMDFLIKLGVSTDRLKTFSWGNEKPLKKGTDKHSRAWNRRVSFVIVD
ncbi:MAG: OmpA family protein [Bacteriovoracia bacterium]